MSGMNWAQVRITLSTGRVIVHEQQPNGDWSGLVDGDRNASMTDAEWKEYCDRCQVLRNLHRLGKAIDTARGHQGPPTSPVTFAEPISDTTQPYEAPDGPRPMMPEWGEDAN